MRRLVVSLSAATVLLIGGVVAGSPVGGAGQPETVPSTEPAASSEAAASTEGHPIVGTWLLVVDDFDDPPSLVALTSDGIYLQAEYDGLAGYGSWEATGPSSVSLTFMQQFEGEGGEFGGSAIIRAVAEVNEDGQSLTGEFTVELRDGAGPPGEYGPGTVSATRIAVEPMGTPAGSLEDLFGAFEEEGTEPASEDTAAEGTLPVTDTTEATPTTT